MSGRLRRLLPCDRKKAYLMGGPKESETDSSEQGEQPPGSSHQPSKNADIVVGLVGPDIEHLDTGGGTAAVSLQIVNAFSSNRTVAIVPIRNYYSFALWRRISAACDAVWRIWRQRNELTIVHIQVTGGLSIERDLPLALVARFASLPVVVQFHGAGQSDDYESGTALHRLCYRNLLAISTVVVVLGKHAETWVRQINPKVATRIIGNSVNTQASPLPLIGDTPRILFAGRMGQRKGVYDLISALEKLAQAGFEFYAEFAGDGEIERVAQLVQESGVLRERVAVLGWQSSSAFARSHDQIVVVGSPVLRGRHAVGGS